MLARDTEQRPVGNALGIVTHAFEVFRHHEQLGKIVDLGGFLRSANKLDDARRRFVVKLVNGIVHGKDLARSLFVSLGKRAVGSFDHVRRTLREGGEVLLQPRRRFSGHVLGKIRHIPRFRVDMRNVRHRTESARNEAQVACDQRLLEQHDIQAFALDFGTQAVFELAALQGRHRQLRHSLQARCQPHGCPRRSFRSGASGSLPGSPAA